MTLDEKLKEFKEYAEKAITNGPTARQQVLKLIRIIEIQRAALEYFQGDHPELLEPGLHGYAAKKALVECEKIAEEM